MAIAMMSTTMKTAFMMAWTAVDSMSTQTSVRSAFVTVSNTSYQAAVFNQFSETPIKGRRTRVRYPYDYRPAVHSMEKFNFSHLLHVRAHTEKGVKN